MHGQNLAGVVVAGIVCFTPAVVVAWFLFRRKK